MILVQFFKGFSGNFAEEKSSEDTISYLMFQHCLKYENSEQALFFLLLAWY